MTLPHLCQGPGRRGILCGIAALVCVHPARPAAAGTAFDSIPVAMHQKAMRLAIAQAGRNPRYPYGAVIVRAGTDEVLGQGVNDSRANPVLHGEISAINDYVARHGNAGWRDAVLYTTAEPCPMCMGALIWAGIGGVVFATSMATVDRMAGGGYGIGITAQAMLDATQGFNGQLLGGVLAAETDALFAAARQMPPG